MSADRLAALRGRRDAAARVVATRTFDLGGLTAEMVDAGQFRLDVLTQRAAELRAAEVELAELDRQLADAERSVAGRCGRCAAINPADAAFCSRCGGSLAHAGPSAVA